MPAFTTLALLGLGGLAGGLAASKIAKGKGDNSGDTTDPSQSRFHGTPALAGAPPPVPPSTSQNAAEAAGLAQTAADRARKRAAAGSNILSGAGTSMNQAAVLQPRSLLGS